MISADDLIQAVSHAVDQALQQNNVHINAFKFGRRKSDFSRGDIFLSRGCINIAKEIPLMNVGLKGNAKASHKNSIGADTLRLKVFATIQDSLIQADGCFIKTVTQDEVNSIVIFLNRQIYFKDTISCVLNENRKYGYDLQKQTGITVINNNLLKDSGHQGLTQNIQESSHDKVKTTVPLESIRSFLIQEHLSLLFEANGCMVTNVMAGDMCDTVMDACTSLDIDVQRFTKVDVSTENIDFLLKSIEGISCIHKSADNTCEFNMKQYMEEKNINIGKNWFDKNLNKCCVCESGVHTDVFRQAVMLNNCKKCMTGQKLLHISGQSVSFTSQKVDLLLKVLTESEIIDQVHFVHSGVSKAKDCEEQGEFNFDTYLKLRYSQMKEAAIMKYGDSVQGEGWEDTLRSLTLACVKFEFLSSTPRNTIKLKLDSKEDRTGENSLQGSFVMYNCARLATLLSHFEENVRNGTYPPLPPIDSVDFCTLREEEEWGLLFNYVYPYPDLVRETIKEIDTKQSLFVPIHTHKIPQMLIGLSRSVSSYYSRYHVLGEARPHLLPIMYARLYLLKAVYQVMCNGLRLMGITPLSQL